MGDLTQNFSRFEFACSCGCGFDTVDYELLVHLQYERAYFGGRQVLILSGCRCRKKNSETPGAARNSQHVLGRAADHRIQGVPVEDQYHYFNTRWRSKYGLGVYLSDRFLHFDTRVARARWVAPGDEFTL